MNICRKNRQLIAVIAPSLYLPPRPFLRRITSGDKEKTSKGKTTSLIRVAPLRRLRSGTGVSELASRRQRVAEKIGTGSILVLFSTEPRVYTNDVDYHYRQRTIFTT